MGSYFGIAVISKEISNVPELQFSRHSNKDYKLTATKVWLELKKATLALAENKLDPQLHTLGCSRCGGGSADLLGLPFLLKKIPKSAIRASGRSRTVQRDSVFVAF